MAANEWILDAKGDRPVRERKRLVATLSLLQGSETADEELAPQSVTGIFDEAFDLYKRHFGVFVMIAAVILLPIQLACYALHAVWLQKLAADVAAHTQSGTEDYGGTLLVWFGYFLIGDPRRGIPGIFSFCAPFLISGPISVAVSDSYLGRQPSMRAAYRAMSGYLPRLIGTYLLAGLACIAVAAGGAMVISVVVSLLALALAWVLPEVWGITTLVLALVPYIVAAAFMARYFALTTPVAVLEGAPTLYVTGRNSQLVGRLRYRATILAMVFLPLLTFGFQYILIYSVDSSMAQFMLPDAVQFLIRTCAGAAAFCFIQPYWMIFVTLLYYNYRVQRECFDVRILSAKLQEMPPIPPRMDAPIARRWHPGDPTPPYTPGTPIRPGGMR
ncbi:MAG TPA: hypothetical protein VKU00_34815 [Chthonomonadaceae bacterium]|nr:hypothetical protein [Chthonomonadaceae bacterium]